MKRTCEQIDIASRVKSFQYGRGMIAIVRHGYIASQPMPSPDRGVLCIKCFDRGAPPSPSPPARKILKIQGAKGESPRKILSSQDLRGKYRSEERRVGKEGRSRWS